MDNCTRSWFELIDSQDSDIWCIAKNANWSYPLLQDPIPSNISLIYNLSSIALYPYENTINWNVFTYFISNASIEEVEIWNDNKYNTRELIYARTALNDTLNSGEVPILKNITGLIIMNGKVEVTLRPSSEEDIESPTVGPTKPGNDISIGSPNGGFYDRLTCGDVAADSIPCRCFNGNSDGIVYSRTICKSNSDIPIFIASGFAIVLSFIVILVLFRRRKSENTSLIQTENPIQQRNSAQ